MDIADPKKRQTVWILGAGFSKGVGGPLIQDLLAHRELSVLESYFPKTTYGSAAQDLFKARVFFNYGLDRRYWDHAEQFLDLVESAAEEHGPERSQAHSLLTAMLKQTVRYPPTVPGGVPSFPPRIVPEVPGPAHEFENIGELASACRRALAVDCSLFLRSAQLDTERWSPYKHWAQSLDPSQTVVTFNYDHVPELLAKESKNLHIVHPHDAAEGMAEARRLDRAPVIKVHGSVTWLRATDGKGIEVMPLGDKRIGDPNSDVAIGVPGPAKRNLYRNTLSGLRNAAVSRIKTADRVVFVGYRFPPTDADAKLDILRALTENAQRNPVVIETVLGPRVESEDSVRLRKLIEMALAPNQESDHQVQQIPLFAEDYLLTGAPT